MVQVGHYVDNAHAAVEHLSANRVPKGMWRETIDFIVWPEQWHFLRKRCELMTEALELIQSVFSAKEIASAEVIGYIFD
jgi:hypothetical protein